MSAKWNDAVEKAVAVVLTECGAGSKIKTNTGRQQFAGLRFSKVLKQQVPHLDLVGFKGLDPHEWDVKSFALRQASDGGWYFPIERRKFDDYLKYQTDYRQGDVNFGISLVYHPIRTNYPDGGPGIYVAQLDQVSPYKLICQENLQPQDSSYFDVPMYNLAARFFTRLCGTQRFVFLRSKFEGS